MEIDTVDRLGKFLYQADLHEVPPLVQASTLISDRTGFTATSFAAELLRPRRKSETAMLRLVYILGNRHGDPEYELSQEPRVGGATVRFECSVNSG
jgi:hypothetical protein